VTYEDAVRASAFLGMSIDAVLRMTPWEIAMVSEEKAKVVNAMHETVITAGWVSAVLQRRKKIPSLASILAKKGEKKTASRQELEELKEEFGLG